MTALNPIRLVANEAWKRGWFLVVCCLCVNIGFCIAAISASKVTLRYFVFPTLIWIGVQSVIVRPVFSTLRRLPISQRDLAHLFWWTTCGIPAVMSVLALCIAGAIDAVAFRHSPLQSWLVTLIPLTIGIAGIMQNMISTAPMNDGGVAAWVFRLNRIAICVTVALLFIGDQALALVPLTIVGVLFAGLTYRYAEDLLDAQLRATIATNVSSTLHRTSRPGLGLGPATRKFIRYFDSLAAFLLALCSPVLLVYFVSGGDSASASPPTDPFSGLATIGAFIALTIFFTGLIRSAQLQTAVRLLRALPLTAMRIVAMILRQAIMLTTLLVVACLATNYFFKITTPATLIAIGVQLLGVQALWIAYSFVHRESRSITRMAFMLGSAIWFVIVVVLAIFEFYWFTWLTGLAVCASAFLWTHRNITHKSATYHSNSFELERMRALQNSQLNEHYPR